MSETRKCTLCDGEGLTDNNEDVSERAPWSFWEKLEPPSNMAVVFGLVQPTPCVRCQTEEAGS